jgi:hypothetical protein
MRSPFKKRKVTKNRFATVKWEKIGLWNLDGALSQIIADGIGEFRKNLHGYPVDFASLSAPTGTMEEWEAILEEMESGFRSWKGGYDDEEDEKLNRSLELLSKWFMALWD